MKMKQIVACAALFAATGISAPAFAGATGNVGVFSEYLFRGVEQSGGAAVQGGLDYASDSGFYVGTWLSNTNFANGTDGVSYETDVYAGYSTKLGDVGFDIGALYYHYTDSDSLNTIEGYVGLSAGMFSAKAFYTPDYFGTDESAYYVTGTATFPLSASVNLAVNAGYNAGDGVKAFLGDEYLDYGATIVKTLDAGFVFSLGVINTDIDGDDPKAVLGLKKTFEL